MKKLLASIAFTFFAAFAFAQEQVEITYTYYDAPANKKVKEIFHHKQVVRIMPDKKHPGEYLDTMYYVKSGPYTYYYENGKVQYTGFYNGEKKDSIWRYYDPKGLLMRTEKYRNGQMVK